MKVEGLVFAGVATADNGGVAGFLADVLGVEMETTGDVHRLVFPNGSSLALVPPDYVEPPSDTILGFLVDDVEAAAVELAAKGIEPDGELGGRLGPPLSALPRTGRTPVRAPRPEGLAPVLLVVAIVLAIFVLDEPWTWIAVLAGATWELAETTLIVRWSKGGRAVVGAEALVGQRALVAAECRPSGQVRVGGELWQARCEPGADVGDEVDRHGPGWPDARRGALVGPTRRPAVPRRGGSRASPPLELVAAHRQPQPRQAPEERLERDLGLEPRQRRSEAVVAAAPEGEVSRVLPGHVEPIGIREALGSRPAAARIGITRSPLRIVCPPSSTSVAAQRFRLRSTGPS